MNKKEMVMVQNRRLLCRVGAGSTVLLVSGELDKTLHSSGKRDSQLSRCLQEMMNGLFFFLF